MYGLSKDATPKPDFKKIYGGLVDAGARSYRRDRDLPRVLHLFPEEMADFTIPGYRKIIDILERRAAGMRNAALRGHWSYEPELHLAVLSALKAERMALAAIIKDAA